MTSQFFDLQGLSDFDVCRDECGHEDGHDYKLSDQYLEGYASALWKAAEYTRNEDIRDLWRKVVHELDRRSDERVWNSFMDEAAKILPIDENNVWEAEAYLPGEESVVIKMKGSPSDRTFTLSGPSILSGTMVLRGVTSTLASLRVIASLYREPKGI